MLDSSDCFDEIRSVFNSTSKYNSMSSSYYGVLPAVLFLQEYISKKSECLPLQFCEITKA